MKHLLLAILALFFMPFNGCGTNTFDSIGLNGKEDKGDDKGDGKGDDNDGAVASKCAGKDTEDYDFRVVTIGTQTWMAENLNCDIEGSRCYDDNPANCDKYGRLYDWETAKTACPDGWHLPTYNEWGPIKSYVEADNNCYWCAGKYLKAASGWDNLDNGQSLNGLDTYGFGALPGGEYETNSSRFLAGGYRGQWWTASYAPGGSTPGIWYVSTDDVLWTTSWPSTMNSVRCLKD